MNEFEAPLEPMEPKRQPRGCLFYGCLTAGIVGLLTLILVGLAMFSAYRYYTRMVAQYTSTAPMELPRVELPKEQAEALDTRVEAFKTALDTGKDVKPLVLTADEINTLITKNEEFRDRVHVDLPGDKVEGQISLPLEKIGLPGLKGRYLNGKGRFNVVLTNGQLFVTLDTLEVNGKPLPDEALASFRTQNMAAGYAENPENAKAIRKLESIEVKDGKLIVKPRAQAENEEEKKAEPDAGAAKPAPKEEPKGEDKGATPKAEPAPKEEPKAETAESAPAKP